MENIIICNPNALDNAFKKEVLASKLRSAGYQGNVYYHQGMVSKEMGNLANLIIYWIPSHLDDATLVNFADNFLDNASKSLIGCWPYANCYDKVCGLFSNPLQSLDEIAAVVNRELSRRK